MKYDIITFGSASEDIFVFSKDFFNKKLCFPLGEKIEMDKIMIHTGGGGTNSAATFALQGLKTAYCGSIGDDYAGHSVVLALKKFGISAEYLDTIKGKATNHSVILSKKEKGRVILVYRDASNYPPRSFDLSKMKTKWFYLAPLAQKMAKKTQTIISYAKKNKIKVACNPSKEQIEMMKVNLKKYLENIDVLLMNKKERELLFGEKPAEKIFQELKGTFSGIFATGGNKEMHFFDGKNIFKIKIKKLKEITDKTGAGDAFGSGLVAGLITKNNLQSAIELAFANTEACLRKWGAKEGLLKKGERHKKAKIEKITL